MNKNGNRIKVFSKILNKFGTIPIQEFNQRLYSIDNRKIKPATNKVKDGRTPIKGIDYFTPKEIESVKKEIIKEIPIPDNGITPIKGRDYFTPKEIESVVADVCKKIPKPKELIEMVISKIEIPECKEVILDDGEKIVSKINDLEAVPSKQIDYKHIKNIPPRGESFGGGARTFTQLGDVPQTYTGQSGKSLRVKTTEDGLEFFTGSGLIDWGEIGGTLSHQTDLKNALDLLVSNINIQQFESLLGSKLGYNNYMEYTEVAGDITQVNYWTDSGKGTKLFTKDITYTSGNPTLVVITDEISGKILTTTIAYSGDDIASVTKVLT
jgi:hypothetical protein